MHGVQRRSCSRVPGRVRAELHEKRGANDVAGPTSADKRGFSPILFPRLGSARVRPLALCVPSSTATFNAANNVARVAERLLLAMGRSLSA